MLHILNTVKTKKALKCECKTLDYMRFYHLKTSFCKAEMKLKTCLKEHA